MNNTNLLFFKVLENNLLKKQDSFSRIFSLIFGNKLQKMSSDVLSDFYANGATNTIPSFKRMLTLQLLCSLGRAVMHSWRVRSLVMLSNIYNVDCK